MACASCIGCRGSAPVEACDAQGSAAGPRVGDLRSVKPRGRTLAARPLLFWLLLLSVSLSMGCWLVEAAMREYLTKVGKCTYCGSDRWIDECAYGDIVRT